MPENTDEKTLPSVSDQKSLTPVEPVTSENLPKNVSMQLFGLMKQVVAKEVTPATVNAACSCATEIHRMLKLNLELKKQGL